MLVEYKIKGGTAVRNFKLNFDLDKRSDFENGWKLSYYSSDDPKISVYLEGFDVVTMQIDSQLNIIFSPHKNTEEMYSLFKKEVDTDWAIAMHQAIHGTI